MVLNSLSVDPARVWKGVWRWYSEELLNCCTPLDVIKMKGLTIPEFSCLARCNGAKAETVYADVSDEATFRDFVRRACAKPEGEVIVVSYDRKGLKQTGAGHFSPIGGYNASRDMCLVMDVARFKYPPHWVPISDLFNAMKPHDPETGRSRGFVRVTGGGRMSVFCRVRADSNQWKDVVRTVSVRFPEALRATAPTSVADVVRSFLGLTQELSIAETGLNLFDAFVTYQAVLKGKLSPEHARLIDQLFSELHATPMFRLIDDLTSSARDIPPPQDTFAQTTLSHTSPIPPAASSDALATALSPVPRSTSTDLGAPASPADSGRVCNELLTVILLSFPDDAIAALLPPPLFAEFQRVRDVSPSTLLRSEVEAVRLTFDTIAELACCSATKTTSTSCCGHADVTA